ncbi:hypothetical protein Pmani_028375 [Petrolisthes manimaculis]|uniref:DUF5641 domain-containing protein n=1 Tax=Petrolisthes manimaculis TaxID=1843537 RepID=A0AAE1TMK5_9EUCA|nr:hypothetical protein Pmani_036285 [Petrolisthes manimaculis]KAK4299342.1 hypothetical protein Pmani_028375 [Petrolisthes manimaculis]
MESEHVKQLKQQRATAKRRFTRKVNIFRESVCQEDPLSVLQHNYGEVSHAYIEVENIHEKYVELLIETTTDEDLIEDEDQYIMDIERKRNDSHALLAKKSDQQLKVNVSKAKVKVKALDPPVFNGDIREYPAFKADFERLMNDSFGKDPFALKQCLSGDALKAVKGVEIDYDQMFKRLDEKYGNCRKIVDVVLCDLKSLRKISDGDSKGFVKMVEKVERCWLDLKRMNLASEMNTSNTVSHIEKILPMTQKREWVILAEDITDPQKIFEELLEFLLKEKRVLEYMDSSIRSTVSLEKVNIHSINGSHGPDLGVPNGSCEIVEAIKKLQENQECQNKKLEQFYIDLAEGYSTEDFLTTFRRFVALRGFPRMIHSDGGSQLVAASKELRQIMSTWNMSDIIQFGSNEGLSWSFNKAADAPWQNGCSEALIKVIKRSIMMSIGDSVLTFGELQTVLFEVANLTNERPIGIKPGTDLELGNYLCPNDLLLGRASVKVPSGAWDNTGNSKHRLEFIQKIVTNFWRRWQRDYFPTLIVRQKWHVSKRNVKVGDIVLLQESNAVIGKWKLAQVVLVIPGHDDKVRNVTLRYKIQKPDKKYNGEPDMLVNRSVHRLVVLLPIEEQCT